MQLIAEDKLVELVSNFNDEEIWRMYGLAKNQLKLRGLVRTNNIVGERGEFLATEIYTNTPGLPNLQKAPEGTQNIDALSRKGERYSIKTISAPGKTTGVFYGIEKDDIFPEKKFEFLIIVLLDQYLNLLNIYEVDWNTFIKHKRWHSRMRAFNISMTRHFVEEAKKIV